MIPHRVVSIGYEKRSVEDFVGELRDHGVSKLVDVRETPVSRRRGFSKTRLSEALGQAGIEYRHVRSAGNPHRKDAEDLERCLQLYRGYLHRSPEIIDLVGSELDAEPVAFLCYERCHECCHRSVLLEMLEEAGYVLEVMRVE